MRLLKSTTSTRNPGLLLLLLLLFLIVKVVVVVYYLALYSVIDCYDSSCSSSTSLRSSSSTSGKSSSNNSRPKRGIHQSRYRKNRFHQLVQRHLETDEERILQHEEEEEEEQDRILSNDNNNDINIYVNSNTGNDSNDGTTYLKSVKTLQKALNLVKQVRRPLKANLIINLSGTFELGERLVLGDKHRGTSNTKRVIFRGDTTINTIDTNNSNKPAATKIIGGRNLDFVKGTFNCSAVLCCTF
jgi:hypothetical protein